MSDDTTLGSKTCTGCRQEFDVSFFGRRKLSQDGLNPRCKECERIRASTWRANNYEKFLTTQRVRSAALDPEWKRARDRAAYARRVAPLQEARALAKLERKNRPRTARQIRAAENKMIRAAANPGYHRDYAQLHRLAYASNNGRFRARRKGSAVVDFSEQQLIARIEYFGGKCWMCGAEWEHLDHIKPIGKGGPHMLANIRPACSTCNKMKGQAWPYSQPNKQEKT